MAKCRLRDDKTLKPSASSLNISSKSTVSTDRATLIFFCDKCALSDLAGKSSPSRRESEPISFEPLKVTLFLQDEKPICIGYKLSDVILPFSGVELTEFELDTRAARTLSFSEKMRMIV